jgi:hypothetical protein
MTSHHAESTARIITLQKEVCASEVDGFVLQSLHVNLRIGLEPPAQASGVGCRVRGEGFRAELASMTSHHAESTMRIITLKKEVHGAGV